MNTHTHHKLCSLLTQNTSYEHSPKQHYQHCHPNNTKLRILLYQQNRYELCHPNNTSYELCYSNRSIKSLIPQTQAMNTVPSTHKQCRPNTQAMTIVTQTHKAMNTITVDPTHKLWPLLTKHTKLWILSLSTQHTSYDHCYPNSQSYEYCHTNTQKLSSRHTNYEHLLKFAYKLWTMSPQHTSYEHCHPNTQAMKLTPAHSYIGHEHRYSTKTSNEHSPQQTVIQTT